MLIGWQVKVILVNFSIGDHAHLKLHLSDSRLTNFCLLPLGFRFLFQSLDRLDQQLTVMTLLANVILHLLVVGVDFWLDIRVHLFDFLAKLAHQLVHFASELC